MIYIRKTLENIAVTSVVLTGAVGYWVVIAALLLNEYDHAYPVDAHTSTSSRS